MGARESLVVLSIALLSACGSVSKPAGGGAAEAGAAGTKVDTAEAGGQSGAAVTLTADQVAKLGIATAPAAAVSYFPGAQGFGVVVGHDLIAQMAADLNTATAAVDQSQAALERGQRLASGPGALGTDALETAKRQVVADRAALELARRRLSAALGLDFTRRSADLDSLASGTVKLARITFPAGSLDSERPGSLRISQVDAAPVRTWTSSELWDAPQDPTLPGHSFFAVLRSPAIPEGARLQALAVWTHGTAGVLVPASAVIVSNGEYWCYVQRKAGTFERTAMDTSRPLADGYFVSDGIAAGDRVVVSAAGLLLARQMNASTAPD